MTKKDAVTSLKWLILSTIVVAGQPRRGKRFTESTCHPLCLETSAVLENKLYSDDRPD